MNGIFASEIFNPQEMIRIGGLLFLFLLVYAQTGLFFCFFLPGGAALFTSGVLIATGDLSHSLFTVCITLTLASVLGNLTGYWFGKKTGPLLYKRKDSRFFKRQYLDRAGAFYNKYGGLALGAGLFFPIIRTFAPIVAGIIRMNFVRFVLFVLIGSALWIASMILSGYLLGKLPFLEEYLSYIVITLIVVVSVPVVIRIVREFRRKSE